MHRDYNHKCNAIHNKKPTEEILVTNENESTDKSIIAGNTNNSNDEKITQHLRLQNHDLRLGDIEYGMEDVENMGTDDLMYRIKETGNCTSYMCLQKPRDYSHLDTTLHK
jgi:hypothetical protein